MARHTQQTMDPQQHTGQIHMLLNQASAQARAEIDRIADPKAQALLETTAEVLDGLRKAFEDFEARDEPAWK